MLILGRVSYSNYVSCYWLVAMIKGDMEETLIRLVFIRMVWRNFGPSF